MAKDCLEHCPRISCIIEENLADSIWVASSSYQDDTFSEPEETGADKLLAATMATHDCPGPTIEEVVVVEGFFNKRFVAEEQYVCGLDKHTER